MRPATHPPFAAAIALVVVTAATAAAQPGRIEGRVTRASDSSGVAGMSAQAELASGSAFFGTSTLPDGSYAIDLPPGAYRVKVFSGQDLVGEYYDNVNEFDGDLAKVLTVANGATLTGIDFVLSAAGSIAGSLTGLGPGESVNLSAEDLQTRRFRGSTNSDVGTFTYTLGNLPPGTYRVRANVGIPGLAVQWYNSRSRAAEADAVPVAPDEDVIGIGFPLTAATSLSGQITLSPPGDPTLISLDALDSATGEWVQSVTPAADGRYSIGNLPPGSYVVQASTHNTGYVREYWASGRTNVDRFQSASPTAITVGSPAINIDIDLERGHSISGHTFLDADNDRVQDPGELDIAGAWVNANLAGPCCTGNGISTDAAGNYTIVGLRPGFYTVNISPNPTTGPFVSESWNNRTVLDAADSVDATAGDVTNVDFDPVPGQLISGLAFLDSDGSGTQNGAEPALGGISIRAFEFPTGRCCIHGGTSGDGRYELAVPPGSYRVEASGPGGLIREFWNNVLFQDDATAIASPQANVDFSLQDGTAFGSLRGRVTEPGGSVGIPGVWVRVLDFARGSDLASATTAADGRFALSSIPPGSYRVLFETQDSNRNNDQDFTGEYWTRCQATPSECTPGIISPNDGLVTYPTVPPPLDGLGTDLGTFSLREGGSISGTVLPAPGDGLPLPFRVDVQSDVNSGPFQPFLPGTQVETDGSYQIRGLPAPAAYKVRAATRGSDFIPVWHQSPSQSTPFNNLATAVPVGVGSDSGGVDLFLQRGGSISGLVTCATGGAPLADVPISAGLNSASGGFGVGTQTGPDGRYTLRGLPAGTYDVRVDLRGPLPSGACGGNVGNEAYPGLVDVVGTFDTPNIDFALDPGGSVRGRVTQTVAGNPTPQPVVNLRIEASDLGTGGFVSDDFTDFGGNYTIFALPQGQSYRVRAATRDGGNQDPQFFNFIEEFYDNKVFRNQADPVNVPNATPVSGIDFHLDLGGAITGTVFDDVANLPISGANVCANLYDNGGFGNCDSTDHNGFFVIRGLMAGDYRVQAAAPGNFVPEFFDDTTEFDLAARVPVAASLNGSVPLTQNVDFRLVAGRIISGRVFHDADGDGVQDAGESGLSIYVGLSESSFFQGARADANGDYAIPGVVPGQYHLNTDACCGLYADEYYRRAPTGVGPAVGTFRQDEAEVVDVSTNDATGIDFSLGLGGSIEGTVREEGTGTPLGGIRVNANASTSGGSIGRGTQTDSAGFYRIDGVAPLPHNVRAMDNTGVYVGETFDNKIFGADPVAVASGATVSGINFDLARGGAIEGVVYRDLNANSAYDAGIDLPTTGANVTVSQFASPFNCCFGGGDSSTGPDGRFRFGGLPSGTALRVLIDPPPDSDYIRVYYDGGDDRGTADSNTATSVFVTPGGTTGNVNFALDLGGALDGDVYSDLDGDGVRDGGEPGIADVNINVSLFANGQCCFGTGTRRTDASGHFQVRGLPTGVGLRVQATPPGDFVRVYFDGSDDRGTTDFNSALPVTVAAGVTTPGINFGLALGGALEGTVYHDLNGDGVQDTGEPLLPSFTIDVSEAATGSCCFGNGPRQTDSNGHFRLTGLRAGVAYRVRVNPSPADFIAVYYDGPAGGDRGTTDANAAQSVFPSAGGTVAGINFALRPGGVISGSVKSGTGAPIGNYCCVNAQPLTPGLSGNGSSVDANGLFVIHGLAPGQYRVDSGFPAGFTREFWNDKPDNGSADPVTVNVGSTVPASVDFILSFRPNLVSGPTPATGARSTTVPDVQVRATGLAGPACAAIPVAPCSRVEIGGGGLTLGPQDLTGDTLTFDVTIDANAALGARSLSIVNYFSLETSAFVVSNSFEVTAGGTPPAPGGDRLYVSNGDASRLHAYGTADGSPRPPIDLCCDPGAIALSGDGRLAYVAGGDRTLAVVDLDLEKEVYRAPLLGAFNATGLVASPDFVYSVNREFGTNNRVQIHDARTWEPAGHVIVGTNPSGLRLDPLGRWVYVANQSSATVSVIDANTNTLLSTVVLPAGVQPRGLAFTPGGARAYLVAQQNVWVIDTSLAASNPVQALVDADGDPATGFATATQTGISPISTGGNQGQGQIEIAALPGAPGTVVAYVMSGGPNVRVIDVAVNRVVRTVPVGRFQGAMRLSADGSRLYFGYSASKDLYVLDTAGILTSPSVSLTQLDRDRGPQDPLFPAGMAVGPIPLPPAGPRPSVSAVSVDGGSPARSGAPISVTIDGSNFLVDVALNRPLVWLRGTTVRGTVLAGSGGSSLRVGFPVTTPTGDHEIVVTNVKLSGNESSNSSVTLAVRSPVSFETTQNAYVTIFGKDRITVYQPGGTTGAVLTQPAPGGVAVTPDGRRGLVQQFYSSSFPAAGDYPALDGQLSTFDLDPASPQFRQVINSDAYVYGSFESPAVTPRLDDPDGIFAYMPNRNLSDTVSVIDPNSGAELDIDANPATQTYSLADPNVGDLGTRLPGLNRIELDPVAGDFNTQPTDTALTPDGNLLYTADIGLITGSPGRPSVTPGLTIVNAVTRQKVGRITTDGSPTGELRLVTNVAVSPSGAHVFALGLDSVVAADGMASPYLFAYNASVLGNPGAFAFRIAMPDTPLPGETARFTELPRGLTLTPDGNVLYTVARLRGELWVIDVPTRTLTARIPVAVGLNQLALAQEDDLLYVTNVLRSGVHVFDVSNPLAPVLRTTLGAGPCPGDVAIQPAFGGPQVAGVSPTFGPIAGGTAVVITGANFVDGATVEFAGAPATNVVVDNAFTIHASTPPGVDGLVDLKVTNPDALFGELLARFRYKADVDPPVFTEQPHKVDGSEVWSGPPGLETVTLRVEWKTNEPSTSRVDYGLTSGLGSSATGADATNHEVTLAGLTPATTYFFRATSVDVSANSAANPPAPATFDFTTPDAPDTTVPIIISGPTHTAEVTTAEVGWTTDESSTSRVEYDSVVDGILTQSQTGASGATHAVTLAGLAPATLHEYRVVSADASGNSVQSGISTFTTKQLCDLDPPALSAIEVSYLSNDFVILSWTTNEVSNSFVNYGVTQINEQGIIDVTKVTAHIVFLTNLLPGTAYGFQVGSTDGCGNTALSANPFAGPTQPATQRLPRDVRMGVALLRAGTMLTTLAPTVGFTTPAAPDTAGPAVTTPVVATPLSFDRVLITAGTDESASLRALFGISGFDDSAFDPTFTRTQSLMLAGLAGGTTYNLRVVLTDPKGNATTVNGLGFTTPAAPDTQPPVFTGLAVSAITETSARVSWNTDEPADAIVRFGVQGQPLVDESGLLGLRTSHTISLTGLRSGTTYAFEARSRDAAGNPGSAAGAPFTTGSIPPNIGNITPPSAAQGSSLDVVISGDHFAPNAQASFGAGITVGVPTVNPTGTQVSLHLDMDVGAAVGPRTVQVTNPGSGLSATTSFAIVDQNAPVITVTQPANNAELLSRTLVVTGTLSELSTVTVNGVAATVTPGVPPAFQADITLPADGVNSINVTATDPSGNPSTTVFDVKIMTISIADVSVAEGDSGSRVASFAVTLSAISGQDITAHYTTLDGSAGSPTDYAGGPGSVTVPAGSSGQSLDIPLNPDTTIEPDETFTVRLTNAAGARIDRADAQGTIRNDDAPPRVSVSDASGAEGAAASFTVTLSNPSTQTVTIDYQTADGTAQAGGDYTAATGSLIFAPLEISKPIAITLVGDVLDEADETLFVNLTGAANATLDDAQGQGTILDDDPEPALSIADVSVTEGGPGTTVNAIFGVTLSAPSGRTVSVEYATADGSASGVSDYAPQAATLLSFPPGVTSRSVTVAVNGDGTAEPNETFFVNLTNPANSTLADPQGQGSIVDDDGATALSITDVSIAEGSAGTKNAVFTVSLSSTSAQTVTVSFATADGTAHAALDYVPKLGVLSFPPGVLARTVNILIVGEALFEPDETFFVNLSGATGAPIADGQAVGTILNDDPVPPSLSIGNVSVTEGNSGFKDAVFTISLSFASAQTVTVAFATANGSATAILDYTPRVGILTFLPGVTSRTIAVRVRGDRVDEVEETFLVNLTAPLRATLANGQGVGTIVDNDP